MPCLRFHDHFVGNGVRFRQVAHIKGENQREKRVRSYRHAPLTHALRLLSRGVGVGGVSSRRSSPKASCATLT